MNLGDEIRDMINNSTGNSSIDRILDILQKINERMDELEYLIERESNIK